MEMEKTATQEITIKERLEMLLSSITDLKEFILKAETTEAVNYHLNKLKSYLQDAKGNKIPNVSNFIEEVTLPAVHQLQMHDITRSEMEKRLDELLELIRTKLREENTEKLRKFLIEKAEKAEKQRNTLLEQAKKLEKQRDFYRGNAERAEQLINDPLWSNFLN